MNRTTEELQAMLDAATDGPWEWDLHDLLGPNSTVIGYDDFDGMYFSEHREADDANAAVIAEAPAAIAEVIRLRGIAAAALPYIREAAAHGRDIQDTAPANDLIARLEAAGVR